MASGSFSYFGAFEAILCSEDSSDIFGFVFKTFRVSGAQERSQSGYVIEIWRRFLETSAYCEVLNGKINEAFYVNCELQNLTEYKRLIGRPQKILDTTAPLSSC